MKLDSVVVDNSTHLSKVTAMTSQARIEANQKNAQKSTGPKTAAGKARSRFNGLKHGMRAEQIVLPTEDPAEFAAELQAWTDDWKPPTAARRILVERGAVAAWRLRRSVRVETERLEGLGRQAVAQYDQALGAQIAEGKRWLKGDPEKALGLLNRTYEGIVAQMAMWMTLANAAKSPESWNCLESHHRRLVNLLGLREVDESEAEGASWACSWRLLAFNHARFEDTEGRLTHDEAVELVDTLRVYLLEAVEILRATLDRHASPEEVRKRIAEAAYLDASPEGKCLMRYEAQHDRSLRASITQLMQLTKTGADLEAWASDDEAPTEANEAVSIEIETSSDRGDLEQPDESETISPTEPKPEAVVTSVVQSERDRGGRIWPVAEGSEAEISLSDR